MIDVYIINDIEKLRKDRDMQIQPALPIPSSETYPTPVERQKQSEKEEKSSSRVVEIDLG